MLSALIISLSFTAVLARLAGSLKWALSLAHHVCAKEGGEGLCMRSSKSGEF